MGESEASATSHVGRVTLQPSFVLGASMLVNSATTERVNLPCGSWALEFDEEGFAFVVKIDDDDASSGPRSYWASDLFTRATYEDNVGNVWLLWSGEGADGGGAAGTVGLLDDELATTRQGVVDVHVGLTRSSFPQGVVVHQLERVGARIFWKAGDIHSAACLADKLKRGESRWVRRSWHAWRRFLEELGCLASLCRSV